MQSLRTTLPRTVASMSAPRTFSTTTPRSLARMTLVGRLANTPDVSPTSTGRDLIRYGLGVTTPGPKDENGNRPTSWFNVAAFLDQSAQKDLLTSLPKGTLLYIEADAKMDSFQAQDGSQRRQLNLLQTKFDVLSRPRNQEEGTTGAESNDNAAQEPLSGVGAS